jgi:hypothetical protein
MLLMSRVKDSTFVDYFGVVESRNLNMSNMSSCDLIMTATKVSTFRQIEKMCKMNVSSLRLLYNADK